MKRLIHVCIIIGSLWDVASTVRGEQPVNNGNVVLESFFRDYLEAAFRLEPMLATRLGDHRFDAELDDLSAPRARPFSTMIVLLSPTSPARSTPQIFRVTLRSITKFSASTWNATSG